MNSKQPLAVNYLLKCAVCGGIMLLGQHYRAAGRNTVGDNAVDCVGELFMIAMITYSILGITTLLCTRKRLFTAIFRVRLLCLQKK